MDMSFTIRLVANRFQSRTGSDAMYETLVDLHRTRILEQSLSMRSQDNHGLLFDNLSINSFGWGGDPETFLYVRGSTRIVGLQLQGCVGTKMFSITICGESIKPTDIYSGFPVASLRMRYTRRGWATWTSHCFHNAAEFSPWIFAKQHDR